MNAIKHVIRIFPELTCLFLLFGVPGWYSCQWPAAQDKAQERIERYGTGAISRRYEEINGKKEGKMTDYYADGRLKGERWFQNNIQVGRTVIYYPEGPVREVQYYQNGKKEGGDTLFYPNGRLEFVVNYHEEKKDGYMRKWTPEGALVVETKYAMDSLIEVKGKAVHLDYPSNLKGATAQ